MKKQNAKTVQAQFVAALDARIEASAVPNAKKNLLVERNKFNSDGMKACIQTVIDNGYDFSPLLHNVQNADSKAVSSEQYVAIYALQKVRKALHAIGSNIALEFDGYTQAIVSNMTRLQALSTINAQRTIARNIEFDELEQQVVLKNRMNCTPSTASTQVSSTREMLRILDVCIVHKKTKNDSISFADTANAKAVQQMFSKLAA